MYLDYEFAVREVDRLASESEHFERIEMVAAERVKEGAEIPLALSRARLDKARARNDRPRLKHERNCCKPS